MKRIALGMFLLVFCGTAIHGTVPSLQSPAARPNILFVYADDWGRYASIYDARTRAFAQSGRQNAQH